MKRARKRKRPKSPEKGQLENPFFPAVQTKLWMGKADDTYEKEADKVADQVVDGNQNKSAEPVNQVADAVQEKPAESITALQTKSSEEEQDKGVQMMEEEEAVQQQEEEEETVQQQEEEEETVQQQEEEEETVQQQEEEEETVQQQEEEEEAVQQEEEEEAAQPKTLGGPTSKSKLPGQLKNKKGQGGKLEPKVRTEMESGFGTDFRSVNIHTDAEAQQMNKDLGAQAFTHGNDIYFNEGKYDPDSEQGKRLLAHELTHTIQQGHNKSEDVSKVQMQRQPVQRSCRNLSAEQRAQLISVLQAGVPRMQGYLQQPQQLLGPNNTAQARANISTHIRATIALTREFIAQLGGGEPSFCVIGAPCPGENTHACFVPVTNQIRIRPRIAHSLNRINVSSILHEFKHYKQHLAHAQEVANLNQILVHTDVSELGFEYEAAVTGAIFSGYRIQSTETIRRTDRDGMRDSTGGSTGIVNPIPQEAMEYASGHAVGQLPQGRDELPVINRSYTESGQIERNSNQIYYPVRWNRRTQELVLRSGNRTVQLGTFGIEEIRAGLPINRAFWNSSEAAHHLQGGYRRGILIISDGNQIIKQIMLRTLSREVAAPRSEGSPIEERPIQFPR